SSARAQPPSAPPHRRRRTRRAGSARTAGPRDRTARGTLRDIRRDGPRRAHALADLPRPRRAHHCPDGQADPAGRGIPPPHRPIRRALTAEVRRLLTVRSTGIFAALLIGCCVGPIVLMGIVYDPAYRGPIDAGDLGKCVSIFHVLAIVFAGTHTATEINAGST